MLLLRTAHLRVLRRSLPRLGAVYHRLELEPLQPLLLQMLKSQIVLKEHGLLEMERVLVSMQLKEPTGLWDVVMVPLPLLELGQMLEIMAGDEAWLHQTVR